MGRAPTQELHLTRFQVVNAALDLHFTRCDLRTSILVPPIQAEKVKLECDIFAKQNPEKNSLVWSKNHANKTVDSKEQIVENTCACCFSIQFFYRYRPQVWFLRAFPTFSRIRELYCSKKSMLWKTFLVAARPERQIEIVLIHGTKRNEYSLKRRKLP